MGYNHHPIGTGHTQFTCGSLLCARSLEDKSNKNNSCRVFNFLAICEKGSGCSPQKGIQSAFVCTPFSFLLHTGLLFLNTVPRNKQPEVPCLTSSVHVALFLPFLLSQICQPIKYKPAHPYSGQEEGGNWGTSYQILPVAVIEKRVISVTHLH